MTYSILYSYRPCVGFSLQLVLIKYVLSTEHLITVEEHQPFQWCGLLFPATATPLWSSLRLFTSSQGSFVIVVLRDPFRWWGMAKDHGAPEAGQLSCAWTRKIESHQRASGA